MPGWAQLKAQSVQAAGPLLPEGPVTLRYLPPPVLLRVFLCILHHVLNFIFAEAARGLDNNCSRKEHE